MATTTTTTAAAHDALATAMVPSLSPELWNFAVIVIVCSLIGWLMRLTQHCLTLVDVRFAAKSNAVLHLRDLGPSLLVLEHATVRHFEQLARTKSHETSAPMATVRIPFEVPTASLAVSRVLSPLPFNAAASEPSLRLSFTIRTRTACLVQVLWGVHVDALVERFATSTQSHTSPRSHMSPRSPMAALRHHLSPRTTSVRQRAVELPTLLSLARRQTRRHRLDDSNHDSNDTVDERAQTVASTGVSLTHFVRSGSFQSASPCERFDAWGDHEVVAEMPRSSFAGPVEEIQSLFTEVESDIPTNAAPSSSVSVPLTASVVTESEPRYSAVVLISTLEGGAESSSAKSLDANTVVCQCVAIDLLPTPVRAERFNPVVVKRLTVTRVGVFVQQEIFGRTESEGGECVICLEGELVAALLPCRHLCVCRACLREIDRCPICRAKFSTYACFADEHKGGSDATSSDSVELKVV